VVGRNLVKTTTRPGDVAIVLSRAGEEVRRITDVTIPSRRDQSVERPPGFDALSFTVPADPPVLEAGVYTVSAHVTTDDERGTDRTYASNELPMSIAPRIAGMTPGSVRADTATEVSVACEPKPGAAQRVRLLVAGREFKPTPEGGGLTFAIENLPPGDHIVRLRVDGVDSLRVVRRGDVLEFEKPDTLTVRP